ncbi:MAG: hypothetical protein HYW70_00975 [Candidatus Nealsonbacteria bacterium]|nr:hypothetical protein [Candidatus Nealsonbacteria bacterium]
MLAEVIESRYVSVKKLYSLSANMVKIFDKEKIAQELAVSVHGSLNVFLKLGRYPKTSIADTIKTASKGLCNCHHTTIANRAAISTRVSPLVIFLVPYLKERRKTKNTKNVPISKGRTPQPPFPYHNPARAVL